MNNGLFGFFIGANVTINTQEFETSGVWVKPPNAQLCFIEATGGGGAGGGSAGTAGNRVGGTAGCAYQIILNASELQGTEYVEIGLGGIGTTTATGPTGNDTTFAGLTWSGGVSGSAASRAAYSGGVPGSNWGSGGATSGTGGVINGRHGGWGAGGGGRGGTSAGAPGGKPRSFEFVSSGTGPALGGGAASGEQVKPENDVDGFGEGASGGIGSAAGNHGRRGSGGGAVGSSAATGNGGNGGDGFLRVITYCWE